jgi:hypothetical protein
MAPNVGGYDRIARLVLGPLLLLVGAAGYAGAVRLAVGPIPQALGAVLLAVVGLVLLGTGLSRQCLLYRPFGFSTSDE